MLADGLGTQHTEPQAKLAKSSCLQTLPGAGWRVTPHIQRHQHSLRPMAATKAMPRGAFILFEGADRCGKSTQSAKLFEALKQRGLAVEKWAFPDRTSTQTGQCINGYLAGEHEVDDAAAHLLFSANRWEKRRQLVSALQFGTTLVVDRYAFSGIAYTAAKQKPGLTVTWCRAPDEGLPAPDVVFYLALPPGAAAARTGFGAERYEKEEFQSKVVQVFDSIKDKHWVCLDASLPVEELHKQVLASVESVLQRCQQGACITTLWSGDPMPDEQQDSS